MDTLWTEEARLESGKLIIAGMRQIARTGIRRGHTITRTIPLGNTTVIAVLARYSSPIIVVNALFWSSLVFESGSMAEVLISSDAEIDSDAETRDMKLSGMAGTGIGTAPSSLPTKIDYNRPILVAPIVLKALFRTGITGNNTMMMNVLVEYA